MLLSVYQFGEVILIYYEKLIKQTLIYYSISFDGVMAAGSTAENSLLSHSETMRLAVLIWYCFKTQKDLGP